jgi:hypothetical protein
LDDRKELEVRAELNAFTDDPQVRYLLWCCVGRIALRDQNRSSPVDFRRDRRKIMHISDWLTAEVARASVWLGRNDENGVPKKLLKFGSIDAITEEADRAMALAAAATKKQKLTESDVQTVVELENGYQIVRLLTAVALDDESRMMGHCIGNGAYDAMLASGRMGCYSLRDQNGGGHVTFELDLGLRCLIQLQGKANAMPVRRYRDMLAPFFKENQFTLGETPGQMGFLIDDAGNIHLLNELPEGLTVSADSDLYGDFPVVLPRSMSVFGKLELCDLGLTELPSGLTVGEDLDISGNPIRELPEDLDVWGDIIVDKVPLERYPERLASKLKTISGRWAVAKP